ncbi:hypothetical protein HY227_01275, partial [Candidatus Wolfebacteria bacterium]|nr:hypothetical protein [Candidatus Wolfebacteria bacterium]
MEEERKKEENFDNQDFKKQADLQSAMPLGVPRDLMPQSSAPQIPPPRISPGQNPKRKFWKFAIGFFIIIILAFLTYPAVKYVYYRYLANRTIR